MTAAPAPSTLDNPQEDAPTMRLSGAVMSVDRGRLRAALEVLSTGDGGETPALLLGFVQLMMLRGSASPTGFEGWLDGSLVVIIRQRRAGGISLHVAADTGRGYEEAFEVPFARLPFADLCEAIESDPAIVGPAFVHADDTELTILVVTYVEEDEPAAGLDYDEPMPTVIDFEATLRAQATAPTPRFVGDLDGYDPEATLIGSPSKELLNLARPPKAEARPAVPLTRRRA